MKSPPTMPMRKFVVVHNIPSPYRIHLFTHLARQLRLRNTALHVSFMAMRHRDRPRDWGLSSEVLPFEHSVSWDWGPLLAGKKWHFNPGILIRMAAHQANFLMICGPWDSLTGIFASVVGRCGTSICWAEGNTRSPGILRGPIGWAKRALVRRFKVFAVPGIEGESYAQMLMGRSAGLPRIVKLPNIVDEGRFRLAREFDPATLNEMRGRLGVRSGNRLALWVTRLAPEKGIIETLNMIDSSTLNGWTIAIIGDGRLRQEITDVIAKRGLTEFFELHFNIPYVEMPAAYASADLFMLPSLRDPNPLSVVEALHSGLPIIVSDRIGNLHEALDAGRNGWLISHENPSLSRASLAAAFGSSPAELRTMGERSKEIALKDWTTRIAIERFLDSIPV